MSGAIAYEQFDDASEPTAAAEPDGDLRRLSEVPVEASVEIGRTGMTVGETLDLRVGSVVKLDRLAGEPVDLLVNGTLIAHGEVVIADEQFGLRIIEILEGDAAEMTALTHASAVAVETDDLGGAEAVGEARGAGEPAPARGEAGALALAPAERHA
jgi:flagellar motor switch protein FliN/FliY